MLSPAPALFGLALILASAAPAADAARLEANQAADHIGESATICGEVAAVRDAPELRSEPILLRLGEATAGQAITVVILGEDRATFDAPAAMVGRHLCVSGRIERFRGRPQMVVESCAQVTE